MGKIKLGAFVVDIRNKVGGSVFSRNSSGAYVRNKVTPINPQSAAQQAVRSAFAFLTQNWRSLAVGSRSAFNDAVSGFLRTDVFGDNVTPSGFQLYLRLNRNLQAITQALITLPPVPVDVYTMGALALAANTTGGTWTITFPIAIPAGASVVVRATGPMSAGRNFAKSEYRQIAVLTAADLSPYDAATEYTAVFGGLPPIGMKSFVECHTVLDASGLNSSPVSASDIAA